MTMSSTNSMDPASGVAPTGRLSMRLRPSRRVRFLFGCAATGVAGALLAGAAPVAAQDERAEARPEAGQGEEILVTARRRVESLQDTPIAVSAFSAETLEERQIQQTQDLERITPSLQFKPAGQLSGN